LIMMANRVFSKVNCSAAPRDVSRGYNRGMPKTVLSLHSDTRSRAVERVEAELEVAEGLLRISYRMVGDIGRIVLPPPQPPKRQDELWRRTCCELFLGATDVTDYYEFNFSPSSAWAAYRFSGYRTGMSAAEVSGPLIAVERNAESMTLGTQVALRECPGLKGDYRCAIACVVEEHAGGVSYWALQHAPGKPDFHHRSGFVLVLPAADTLQRSAS
jgi:hypothetical protein